MSVSVSASVGSIKNVTIAITGQGALQSYIPSTVIWRRTPLTTDSFVTLLLNLYLYLPETHSSHHAPALFCHSVKWNNWDFMSKK